jgi:tetratricopeptide (TPR) repeat protein
LTQYVRQHGFEKAMELMRSFPDYADGNEIGLGMSLLREGDPKVALPLLIQAEKKDPKSAAIQALLGDARALTGDRKGALQALRKAAELLPDDKTVGGLREYWKYTIEKGLKDLGQSDTPR